QHAHPDRRGDAARRLQALRLWQGPVDVRVRGLHPRQARDGEHRGMSRYGAQYGPDITFLGVGRCDLADPASFTAADVVVLGAPFDGGTSHRPGTRFGPQAIRMTDYLPHDASRPSLALRTDGLRDLRVLDAGD